MKSIKPLEWIDISDESDEIESCFTETHMARVFGGWIVRERILMSRLSLKESEGWDRACVSMVFVPDKDREWDGDPTLDN